jgi:7,8-dihydropterin-6-yl-methyl-4-(beta-D-ribofuranosyl)aminobenzene 5'-phosphate synthase
MALTVTVLLDNRMRDPSLAAEHGLSLWIDAEGTRVLFDTGPSGAFAENARRLGVPLALADHIVLSHGHYDHAGGLSAALAAAPRATLHLHPEATRTRFSLKNPKRPRSVGLSADTLRTLSEHAARVRWTAGPTLLAPRLGLTGAVPRRTDFEDTGGAFFLDAEGHTPDDLVDDQALWVDTPEGVVVVMGCGHSGLVNTLRQIQDTVRFRHLHGLIGGFHLLRADRRRLEATVRALREWSPDQLAPAHCTGEQAERLLREAFPSAWRPAFVGARLRFSTSP